MTPAEPHDDPPADAWWDPDDRDALDEAFPLGDGVADLSADVSCPWCGAPVELLLDPGSGEEQAYIEDCEVCCRPWQVQVTYHADGHATVQVDPSGDGDDD